MGLFPIKKVDKDAIVPINVIFGVWTNLGPMSDDLIFYAPNVANFGFLRIVPNFAF